MKPFALAFLLPIILMPTGSAFGQGSLTPPGTPAPIMKTLDQIEPRTPIDATHTPGDANNMFIITQPGSYYLTTNLVATGSKNGISIQTNQVALDLKGFSVIGNGSTNATGIITTSGGNNNLAVRNGSIRGWSGSGINTLFSNSQFENLAVDGGQFDLVMDGNGSRMSHCSCTGFGVHGVEVGVGAVVTDCTCDGDNINANIGFVGGYTCVFTGCTSQNAGTGFSLVGGNVLTGCAATGDGNGFLIGSGSTLTGCSATSCSTDGFDADGASACTLIGCTAFFNENVGIAGGSGATISKCTAAITTDNGANNGITTGDNSIVSDCTCLLNLGNGITTGVSCRITGCTVNGNGSSGAGIGILTGIRATVSNCTVNQNATDGIQVSGDSMVSGCHASNNSAAGIHTFGSGSRVDGNQTRDNGGTGILTTGGDIVVRNSSGGNATQYNPATGSNIAPIQTPATATNPMANF